jgi:hypothetical protein
MRRWAGVLALLVVPSWAAAQSSTFSCADEVFDLRACPDLADLTTCPTVCDDPADPATCHLPFLDPVERTVADQPILWVTDVASTSFAGTTLTMLSRSQAEDNRFAAARNRLCVAPPTAPPAPTPTPTPTPGDPTDPPPPTTPTGPGIIRGDSPGLVGGNPGLVGGNPGIEIRRPR